MPPNPPSLVGANHSCKILDPPLKWLALQLKQEAFIIVDYSWAFFVHSQVQVVPPPALKVKQSL